MAINDGEIRDSSSSVVEAVESAVLGRRRDGNVWFTFSCASILDGSPCTGWVPIGTGGGTLDIGRGVGISYGEGGLVRAIPSANELSICVTSTDTTCSSCDPRRSLPSARSLPVPRRAVFRSEPFRLRMPFCWTAVAMALRGLWGASSSVGVMNEESLLAWRETWPGLEDR